MKEIINQIFAIEQKSSKNQDDSYTRNISRIYYELEALGYKVINPIGRIYKNEMTDVEAKISANTKKMEITKVLKPIIYKEENGHPIVAQKGIVIVG